MGILLKVLCLTDFPFDMFCFQSVFPQKISQCVRWESFPLVQIWIMQRSMSAFNEAKCSRVHDDDNNNSRCYEAQVNKYDNECVWLLHSFFNNFTFLTISHSMYDDNICPEFRVLFALQFIRIIMNDSLCTLNNICFCRQIYKRSCSTVHARFINSF